MNAEDPAELTDPAELEEIEAVAAELAGRAGERIVAAVGSTLTVDYKTKGRAGAEPTDPVSEIDQAVEQMLRERLAVRFPGHAIAGEEVEEQPDAAADYLWAIDPVDGTSNFINGFPLFCASIGVLKDGRPVAGATWCASSHELRPGVYSARAGGPIRFEGEPFAPREPHESIRRPLAGAPGGSPGRTIRWDNRVTGSAAIECAFTAAGILLVSSFYGLRIWDVASGVALARSAGMEVRVRRRGQWAELERFEAPAKVREDRAPTLRDWSEPLVMGRPGAVEELLSRQRRPGLRETIRRLFR